jgi:hypothetical protein
MNGQDKITAAVRAVQLLRGKIDVCFLRLRTAEGPERAEINRRLAGLDAQWSAAKEAHELAVRRATG